jgi:hypothetical protein
VIIVANKWGWLSSISTTNAGTTAIKGAISLGISRSVCPDVITWVQSMSDTKAFHINIVYCSWSGYPIECICVTKLNLYPRALPHTLLYSDDHRWGKERSHRLKITIPFFHIIMPLQE